MIRIVQIANASSRRVALVEEPSLRCLVDVTSVYELAQRCLTQGQSLTQAIHALATGECLDYNAIYAGTSAWKLLSPIDVPGQPARVLVAGTGLTHLGSAKERQAMHLADQSQSAQSQSAQSQSAQSQSAQSQSAHSQSAHSKIAQEKPEEVVTDSMRMFRWGVEQGRPAEDTIGIAPEWFYKGDASMLRAPFQPLEIPGHAEDGGEEAEVAGIYLIGPDGTPHRIGMTMGNEFSDHKFERRNYLNLAGSKLRACSLGPELLIDGEFKDIHGEVSIERDGKVIWHKLIATGEENMCHSLANLEHHHFKYRDFRHPGDVHVHFFGAATGSFTKKVETRVGDMFEIQAAQFGRPLRNPLGAAREKDNLVAIRAL